MSEFVYQKKKSASREPDEREGGRATALQDNRPTVVQAKANPPASNRQGLPDGLRAGIESMSGMSMAHVKVHYNSNKPAQLNAHAYAQGSDIHLAAGQQKHLPHEAWHVVQQAQGRVRPTLQMKAGAVNDDPSLEKEADMMGEKAAQFEGDRAPSFQPLSEHGMDDIEAARTSGYKDQRAAGSAIGSTNGTFTAMSSFGRSSLPPISNNSTTFQLGKKRKSVASDTQSADNIHSDTVTAAEGSDAPAMMTDEKDEKELKGNVIDASSLAANGLVAAAAASQPARTKINIRRKARGPKDAKVRTAFDFANSSENVTAAAASPSSSLLTSAPNSSFTTAAVSFAAAQSAFAVPKKPNKLSAPENMLDVDFATSSGSTAAAPASPSNPFFMYAPNGSFTATAVSPAAAQSAFTAPKKPNTLNAPENMLDVDQPASSSSTATAPAYPASSSSAPSKENGFNIALRRRPSFSRSDSVGDVFTVSGTEALSDLRKRNTDFNEKTFSKKSDLSVNVVSLSLTITSKNEKGFDFNVYPSERSWNSGEIQQYTTPHIDQSISIKKYVTSNIKNNIHNYSSYTSQAHAHSEVASADDPFTTQFFRDTINKFGSKKIVNITLNVDSYPNSVCMNLCRFSLADLRAKLDIIAKKHVNLSKNYLTDMRISSAVVFLPSQNPLLHELHKSSSPPEALVPLEHKPVSFELVSSGITLPRHVPAARDEERKRKKAAREKRKMLKDAAVKAAALTKAAAAHKKVLSLQEMPKFVNNENVKKRQKL